MNTSAGFYGIYLRFMCIAPRIYINHNAFVCLNVVSSKKKTLSGIVTEFLRLKLKFMKALPVFLPFSHPLTFYTFDKFAVL